MKSSRPASRSRAIGALALAVLLAGCAVGPDFVRPTPDAPEDWQAWRSADPVLVQAGVEAGLPRGAWWLAYGDPTLDALQQRARDASPDLQAAVLHLAQARVQRGTVASRQLPEVGLDAGVSRQRQSEYGASIRLLDAIGGANRDALVEVLSQPFNLYQAGLGVSWELDLWGRMRRSIEAADADVERQAALLDQAGLMLGGEVARAYFELRTTQRRIALTGEDIAALQQRLDLLDARVRAGTLDHLDLQRQRAELEAQQARLPQLQAQEGASRNQIALLLGQRPGALDAELAAPAAIATDAPATLPALALGVPSDIARRRPDLRAAEAKLHNATANIGVATADLYPSIRLGGQFGYESYLSGEFGSWGSRTWSIGPSLDLPIFDHGRRRGVVQLRKLQQQEAAIAYHQAVLKAWQEIDDALSGYTALQQQVAHLQARQASAGDAYRLAQAKYDGGIADFTAVLDSQRAWLQSRGDLADAQGRLAVQYATLNLALGNVPPAAADSAVR